MTHVQNAERTERWQRFTLLDVLLLQVGFAVGFSLMYLESFDRLGWEYRVPAAILLGAVLAGPIILLVQNAARGRSGPLSLGEWLWISPIALATCGVVGVLVIRGLSLIAPTEPSEALLSAIILSAIFLTSFLVLAEATCALLGLVVLLAGITGSRPRVPCSWTDRFGGATCFLVGAALLAYYFLAGV
jgi:hypothetical protein